MSIHSQPPSYGRPTINNVGTLSGSLSTDAELSFLIDSSDMVLVDIRAVVQPLLLHSPYWEFSWYICW
jgi:hypothetical protein